MLLGHEEKLALFQSLAERGMLGQSYLFFGDEGIGKRTFARSLARFIEYGSFEDSKKPLLDTVVFDPDERGKIGIDAARSLRQFVFGKPFHGSRRIAIVDDAHTLTPEAESALLKVVEEPPRSALLVFITPNADRLLSPLRSRLEEVYFKRFAKSEVERILKEHFKVPAAEAKRLAGDSFGRIGYALRMREKGKNADPEAALHEKIVDLYREGVVRNSGKLKLLLDREMAISRYNVNMNLQSKAIQYVFNN